MMCGYEKKLLVLSLLDAFANLGISVALVLSYGMVGVAVGSLIPTVLIGWLFILPMALRYLNLSIAQYFQFILSAVAPILLFALCLAGTVYFLPMPAEGGFVALAVRGGLSAGPAFIWIFFSAKKLM
jgi:hypothetical protein